MKQYENKYINNNYRVFFSLFFLRNQLAEFERQNHSLKA
jgi:hypothetical protein